jgi:branched-subunit amino acid ABC-type transport system permease component
MHRIIGAGLGALVTYLLLVLFAPNVETQVYVTAVIVGFIVTVAWPWVIAFLLARRVKERRQNEINREVEDQLKAKGG